MTDPRVTEKIKSNTKRPKDRTTSKQSKSLVVDSCYKLAPLKSITMPNWKLEGCCGDTEEILFLSLYAAYSVLTYFLMEKAIAKPMKLIAIFIHEMGQ